MSVAEIIPAPKLTHEPSDWPNIHQLITEDGAPVDNMFSEKQMRLLTEPLYSNWAGPEGDPRFLATANVGLFFTSLESPLVPDVLLSTRVPRLAQDITDKEHSSYFVWLYGKSPDIVIEIVSNKIGGEDGTKPAIYARWGVTYYVIFDPNFYLSEDRLRVFVLNEGKYQRKPDNGWFALLGLGLTLWHGVFENQESIWLRWTNKQSELIPTGAEKATLEHERANRAEQGKLEAEQAKRIAEANLDVERQRNEQLRALLKEKGIDIESL